MACGLRPHGFWWFTPGTIYVVFGDGAEHTRARLSSTPGDWNTNETAGVLGPGRGF